MYKRTGCVDVGRVLRWCLREEATERLELEIDRLDSSARSTCLGKSFIFSNHLTGGQDSCFMNCSDPSNSTR